jgi:chemotaxis protein methyltransferase CheR
MTHLESMHTRRFRDWIAQSLGLRFEDSKLSFLTDVLAARSSNHAMPCASYLDELENPVFGIEVHALIGELTVPETYFFRHVEQYRAYGEVALPAAQIARGPGRRLKVLSVGCASGEEPYSLAMWASDHGAWPVDVSALDINPAMLAKASRGLYGAWALRETSAETQQRWFRRSGAHFELDPAIRAAVTFQRVNLAQPNPEIWTPLRYDVIFCRNVLMYFTTEMAQMVVASMTQALAAHGHLFLGHAETMRGLSTGYHLCHTHGTFYYQRQQPGSLQDGGQRPSAADPAIAALGSATPAWPEAIRDSAERVQALSESFAGAGSARAVRGGARSAVVASRLAGALASLKEERFADALTALNALPQAGAEDAEVLLLRAALLTHGGRLEDAEKVSTTLLALDELNAGAHYLLALCRESAGDPVAAFEHDLAAIHLDADFAMPRLHIGLMARRGGDLISARSALSEAMPLLQTEEATRVLLFGGGFGRDGLIALCRAELAAVAERT